MMGFHGGNCELGTRSRGTAERRLKFWGQRTAVQNWLGKCSGKRVGTTCGRLRGFAPIFPWEVAGWILCAISGVHRCWGRRFKLYCRRRRCPRRHSRKLSVRTMKIKAVQGGFHGPSRWAPQTNSLPHWIHSFSPIGRCRTGELGASRGKDMSTGREGGIRFGLISWNSHVPSKNKQGRLWSEGNFSRRQSRMLMLRIHSDPSVKSAATQSVKSSGNLSINSLNVGSFR